MSLILLSLFAIIDLVLMFVVNPINLMTWSCIFTTMSFILRRVGVHVKVTKVMAVEILIGFLAFNGSLFFKTFDWRKYLLMLMIRGVFYLIVWYDDSQYVYVQEEEEKEM